MNRLAVFVFAWMLLCLSSQASAQYHKVTLAADVVFSENASASKWMDQLDKLACRVLQLNLEFIVVQGHADVGEPDAQKLSVFRAENIRKRLIFLGLSAERIHAEGKGALFPVSKDDVSKNRRVEVEALGYTNQKPEVDCRPEWLRLFETLPLAAASTVAHVQVRDGQIGPGEPAAAAIAARRIDLLDALLKAPNRIILDKEDRVRLMILAIQSGEMRLVDRMLEFGIHIEEFKSPELPLRALACRDYYGGAGKSMDKEDLHRLANALFKLGARPDPAWKHSEYTRTALQCAARSNLLGLADQLLARGANLDLPKESPPVLEAAKSREMIQKLVSAGANPDARSQHGSTLFHEFIFEKAEDVAWIASLGLDINLTSDGGYTPLHMAVRYAPPLVLDAFISHGARFVETSQSLVSSTWGNLPGRLWLVEKGAKLDNPLQIASATARAGDKGVPVMNALYRRGDFQLSARERKDVLEIAMDYFSVDLVQVLARQVPADDPGTLQWAIRFAQSLQIERRVMFPLHVIPGPEWYSEEHNSLNAPNILADRQRRKDRINEILKAVQTAP